MKIGIVGYGKMGKIIEQIALERGHSVPLKISSKNTEDLNETNLGLVDVVIEFTNPEVALENVTKCLNAGVPTVCGSTGWQNDLSKATDLVAKHDTSFIWASNFSVGVNLFWKMNENLAKMMNAYKEYDVKVHEIHHTQKKDAPSGTAITTAEQIVDALDRKKNWELDGTAEDTLNITAARTENVPGTHIVTYTSAIDDIELTHTAHNRNGFALGAIIAAEYIVDKKGVYTMSEVLGL